MILDRPNYFGQVQIILVRFKLDFYSLIFINDLPGACNNSITDMFADDTTLSVHNKSVDFVLSSLSNDLLNINT